MAIKIEGVIPIGTRVRLLRSTYGIGDNDVKLGDIGTVIDTPNLVYRHYSIDIGNCPNFIASPDDIEVVENNIPLALDKLSIDYIGLKRYANRILKTCLQELDNSIYNKQDELKKLYTSVRDTLRAIKSNTSMVGKMKPAEIQNIIKHLLDRYYESIDISKGDGDIIAITKPIVIEEFEYKNGTDIPLRFESINLGQYEVYISYTTIRILNRTSITNRNGYPHPHINANGVPCFGTFYDIPKLHSNGDFLNLLNMIYTYLHSIDQNGWYIPLMYWLPDVDKRCKNCWCFADSCGCDICSYCNEHRANCSCMRCPDNNEVLPNGYDEACRDCSSWDRENATCSY